MSRSSKFNLNIYSLFCLILTPIAFFGLSAASLALIGQRFGVLDRIYFKTGLDVSGALSSLLFYSAFIISVILILLSFYFGLKSFRVNLGHTKVRLFSISLTTISGFAGLIFFAGIMRTIIGY